jgi:hypothetical protein
MNLHKHQHDCSFFSRDVLKWKECLLRLSLSSLGYTNCGNESKSGLYSNLLAIRCHWLLPWGQITHSKEFPPISSPEIIDFHHTYWRKGKNLSILLIYHQVVNNYLGVGTWLQALLAPWELCTLYSHGILFKFRWRKIYKEERSRLMRQVCDL